MLHLLHIVFTSYVVWFVALATLGLWLVAVAVAYCRGHAAGVRWQQAAAEKKRPRPVVVKRRPCELVECVRARRERRATVRCDAN